MWRSGTPDTSDSCDENEVVMRRALKRLHARLIASQPEFAEEDVGFVESTPSCGSPPHSPTHSPTRSPRASFVQWDEMMSESSSAGVVCSPSVLYPLHAELTVPSARGQGSMLCAASAVDLDHPMTCHQFLDAVKDFDGKFLLRSRKAVAGVLKLLCHGYALTWKYTGVLPRITFSGRNSSARLLPSTVRAIDSHNGGCATRAASHSLFEASPCGSPPYQPKGELVCLLDKCVCSLLVYANNSLSLRNMVTSNVALLKLLCFICLEARKLEVSSGGAAVRDFCAELIERTSYWELFALTRPFLEVLQECYLVEFLLDAALPPVVCSTKYDGIIAALCQKKGKLVTDVFYSRSGIGVSLQGLPMRALSALVSMASFVEPRMRVRVLDRMVEGGIVFYIRETMQKIVGESTGTSAFGRDASRGSSCCREDVGDSEGATLWFAEGQESPLRLLDRCLTIMLWLTTPDLVGEAGGPTCSRAVVRCTAWASQLTDIRAICLCLLQLILQAPDRDDRSCFRLEGEHVAVCIRQIAGFNNVTYGVVVSALNDVLERCCCGGEADAAPLLPLVVEMFGHREYAELNMACMSQWLTWLADSLLPEVFEQDFFAHSRGEIAGEGSRCTAAGREECVNRSQWDVALLDRKLSRKQVTSLSTYFHFATRLISESPWCCGEGPFFKKTWLLARSVMLMYSRSPNLVYGQASTCYKAITKHMNVAVALSPRVPLKASYSAFSTPPNRCGNSQPERLTGSPPGRKRRRGGTQDLVSSVSSSTAPAPSTEEAFIASVHPAKLFGLAASCPETIGEDRETGGDSPPDVTTFSSWQKRKGGRALVATTESFSSE